MGSRFRGSRFMGSRFRGSALSDTVQRFNSSNGNYSKP
jgi:hypothetical protein